MNLRGNQQVDVFDPLAQYYAAMRKPLPRFDVISSSCIPLPFHQLLVHECDMTPTLEAFHEQPLILRVLRKRINGEVLERTVTLVGDRDGKAVEFGAIRINLNVFDPQAQTQICQCRVPLGSILRDQAIDHCGIPTAFIRVEPDELMACALGLEGGWRRLGLYGRHNELYDVKGTPLAEVVEVLPPVYRQDGADQATEEL